MITKKFCPNCRSEDVHMIAGGTTGQWMCKNCGHVGPVLEKETMSKKIKSNNMVKNREIKKGINKNG